MVQIVVYGVIAAIYFLVTLRYLGDPLKRLFDYNLTLYGIASLLLMIAQAVLLESVVSYLFDFLGLHRLNN